MSGRDPWSILKIRSYLYNAAAGVTGGGYLAAAIAGAAAMAGVLPAAAVLTALGVAAGGVVAAVAVQAITYPRIPGFARRTPALAVGCAFSAAALCASFSTSAKSHMKTSPVSPAGPLTLQFDRACNTLVQTSANEVTIDVPKGCKVKLLSP